VLRQNAEPALFSALGPLGLLPEEYARRGHEDPLPDGPFDVVVSVLAVHHLDGAGKAELFRRIADSLTPSGRLVLGDFVAPEDPSDLVTPLDPDYDYTQHHRRSAAVAHRSRPATPRCLGTPRSRGPGWPRALHLLTLDERPATRPHAWRTRGESAPVIPALGPRIRSTRRQSVASA